jgi:N,N'-diacetyl-8-epilegionaminate cytidylyltransferase
VKTYAFIFARGGSKGIPRKNIRPFAGKPLIVHTIEMALRMPEISKLIVSTDDEEIAAVARAAGADVPFLRPAELAADNSPEWKSWQHAIHFVRDELGEDFDCFLSLPATSPLRTEEDVRALLARYQESGADIVMGITPAASNPYFNMLRLNDDGSAELVVRPPAGKVFRRQDAPDVFDMAPGGYVTSPDHVLASSGVLDGVLKTTLIPAERAVDIDTMLDFEFAEFLFRKNSIRP